ncbi:MAG TPA: transcriptional regulator, partial [Flavobacteriaceae bacterium]|nr:transcriptional regulator [Flavobacteriaceae bacterium]
RASEILNKKRKLSLSMIRKLTEKLNIPSEVLIQPYE